MPDPCPKPLCHSPSVPVLLGEDVTLKERGTPNLLGRKNKEKVSMTELYRQQLLSPF